MCCGVLYCNFEGEEQGDFSYPMHTYTITCCVLRTTSKEISHKAGPLHVKNMKNDVISINMIVSVARRKHCWFLKMEIVGYVL